MNRVKELKPVFDSVLHQDFRALINYGADAYRGDDAFIIKHKKGKDISYEHIKFEDFRDHVNDLGTALLDKGFAGKRIAIVGKNCYEWVLAYFATLCGLGISVPLDKGLPFDELESSLQRSKADVLVFDSAHLDLVRELQARGSTQVADFISMGELEGFDDINHLMREGRAAREQGRDDYLRLPVDGKATSILLFTSGTTSQAKAVQLSQYNITANVYAMLKVQDIRHGDINMAFLPYHHTFGSTGQVVMLAAGVTTTYCDGLKYLQKNIVEYKVSLFVCVPLLIESIYKRIMQTVKKQGLEKKVNFGLKLSRALLKIGIDMRRKIFKEILDQLGGNIRYIISGASAIDPEALQGFLDFGITTVQGYGMTEAAPVLAAENTWEHKAGSIGLAMPGVDLVIDDPNEEGIGELIARGPNIMSGYYENDEETAKVLADGWLHTGDLAYLDEDGYIFICGRKKNVIVLKNGKTSIRKSWRS